MNTETTTLQNRAGEGPEKLQDRQELTPAVDVFENRDELLIVADLPGVEQQDLTVHLEKSQLSIQGKRAFDGETFEYVRTFVVPNGIDAEKIAAELKDGVLRLKLPKSAAHKPRTIPVRAG